MNLIEFSTIVEIGINKAKVKELEKKNKDLKEYLNHNIHMLLHSLSKIQDLNILTVTQENDIDFTEINDFNYSAHNQCQPNKELNIYRNFNYNLIMEGCEQYTLNDYNKYFGVYIYEYLGLIIKIYVSSIENVKKYNESFYYKGWEQL